MPRGAPLRVVSLRLSDEDIERTKTHGRNAGEAYRRLLDLADEHTTCPPPTGSRKTKRTTGKAPSPLAAGMIAVATAALPAVTYEVDRPGREPYRTADRTKADRVAVREGTEVRTVTA